MKTIDNDIKRQEFKKVYLLYGEERYLIRQYRDKLKNALASPDDTMNFSGFEGEDINVKEIIDLAETLPFFADKIPFARTKCMPLRPLSSLYHSFNALKRLF